MCSQLTLKYISERNLELFNSWFTSTSFRCHVLCPQNETLRTELNPNCNFASRKITVAHERHQTLRAKKHLQALFLLYHLIEKSHGLLLVPHDL